MVFIPWILVWAWITPLPDTVQEQVDEAIGHGFDGIIVYVEESGKPPAFYIGVRHDGYKVQRGRRCAGPAG